jgi:hypothetical protein
VGWTNTVSLPTPEPGLVIPYAYLWRHEYNRGLEEGRKTRPSVIVLAGTTDRFAYGFIPPNLHKLIVERIRQGASRRRVGAIPRD